MDDHTIVAGLGYHRNLEEDEDFLNLTAPQATSTVAAKMTREQLNRQYLQSLEEANEASSKEFQSLRSTLRGSTHDPHLSAEENGGSSGLGVMTALPLIDTEAMSGLSSSNFLMDHTQRPIENETVGEVAGLPSALLEPQWLLLDQDLEGGNIKDLSVLTPYLARSELERDEFSTSQVQFDASQISARSSIHEGSHRGLEASKLLSNSCNSLGSIDGPSDPFLTNQQNVGALDEDWLEAHQGELVEMMEGEEFRSPDLMFFEEEERKYHEENRFCIDNVPAPSKHSLDLSCFSGIHGVNEITVRPSWIGSPEKELLGPNNRMLVDDYLQARSEALGSLGANKDPSTRPNFGKEVYSPPTSTRTQRVVDVSVGDESSVYGDSESSMKQDSFASNLSASDLREGSTENTLVSEEKQVSTTTTVATDQKEEDTVGMEVVHEVEELEASIHTIRQPLEASAISSLLTRALATNAPHDLMDRILRLTGKPAVPSTPLETTGLDASLQVMELRQMREDMVRQNQKGLKPSGPPGKENRGKEDGSKPTCIPSRKPLQNVVQPGQRPLSAVPHKHVKLNAVRTNSDPGIPTYTYQEKNEFGLEETLQGAQYMSKLVDDTAKLMLPSFNEDGAAVESSTPCIPRTQTPVPDPLYGETLPPASSNQRALPRMGLWSTTKGSGRKPELKGVSGEAGLRTTASRPPNLSTHPTTITTNAHVRPHHHKDIISQSLTSPIGVSVPQSVVLPEACVVGMATYTTLPLHNPSSRWLQVSLSLVKETLDGSTSMASVLLFQPSYFLEPLARCDVRLGVCCPVQGHLEALLELRIGELTTSGTRSTSPSSHIIVVSAAITMPKVEVQCVDGVDCVDFGVVGESCRLSRTVTLINHCPQPLPLLLQLHQVAGRAPLFCWEEDNNKTGSVVSASHLSCELSPSIPTTFSLTLRAPHIDGVSVTPNGRVQVGSFLSVLLDTPAPTPLTLASHPIKAAIGVVQLQILRTHEPLLVNANPHQSGTTHLTLKNASSFPLHISLSVKDESQAFSLHPSSLTMPPGACSSPALFFTPGGHVGTLNSMLVVRVEPEGMEFKIAVSGVCRAPSQTSSSVLVSGSTPPSTTTVRTAAPPIAPVTNQAPASTSVPAPPVQAAHKQVHKIRAALTKCDSAPLSEVTSSSPPLGEKRLSSALQSTKSRLVFGTVGVGATSCQKLVFRNNLTTRKLPLSVTIIGSQAFQVCESGSEDGQEKLDVVLKPCEELSLSVMLRPSSVEPLSATLICRHCSSSDPFKWKIPLQGYGGRGELVVKDGTAGKALIIKDLSLGLPAILQTSVTNTGHRTLFLILQMFSDEQCKEPATDLSVQSNRLVLGAGETHEVYIVASGSLRQLARTPGLLGVLQAVSVEEVLRQRYQRMKNKEVKARRINNPDLLKLNWLEEFTGEQKFHQESDILPPQTEDAVVFFNACSITQVEVWGDQRPNEDHSSTVFACLAGEQTMADFTTSQMERVGSSDSPSTLGNPNMLQPSSAASWDVLPQTMSVRCGDTSPQFFFVVNFTSTQQMLEVSSSYKWLEIKPREAVLLGHSSLKLCVTVNPPHTVTSSLVHSLKVMGENESRSATITIVPATTETLESPDKSSPSLPVVDANPLPITAKQAPRNSHHTKANTLQPVTTTTTSQSCAPVKSSQPPPRLPSSTTNTTHYHTQGIAAASARPPAPSQSLVQLVCDDVSFPDTRATQETFVKVMLRNLDKIVHSVQAEVTYGAFVVRHTQFTIKSGHYVSVPVYFRPQKAGLCTGKLQLTVLKDKLVLPVRLSGRALP